MMAVVMQAPLAGADIQHPYIERRAEVVGGEPIIVGTRIAVRVIAGWHRMGSTADEIVAMYPHLNHAQVYDALSYYYDHKGEIERLLAENEEDKVMRDTASV